MKYFWFEKQFSKHITIYFGNGCNSIIGIVIGGRTNYIYLFGLCLGIDFN